MSADTARVEYARPGQSERGVRETHHAGRRDEAVTKADVLIVEDDAEIADLIRFHIEREGYRARVVRSGRDALEASLRRPPDLVILDIMLPDLDGLEVTRRLKREAPTSGVSILMVSARGEESDIVAGLELGADDYVTKPFSPRVLIARVRSVLRRREDAPAAADAGQSMISLLSGDIRIDPAQHAVQAGGEPVRLTLTEFRLLHFLALRPGFVRTRDQIVSAVRGEGTVLSSRAVDVHVASLRRKLGDRSWIVETVRGVGYRCASERSQADNTDQ
jgi:two-component system, OmpR family, alkaline phosphatase synthesis response regulator PhoP